MSLRFGLDYAWTTITPAAHKAVGSTFACRYLSNDASKNLSRGEADELRSNGIDIVVVWETTATRALDGSAAGLADARAAQSQATALGMPAGRPIYFAADFDESPNQAAAVSEYFRGVNDVLGVARSGCYSGYWTVKRLFDSKRIAYGWSTYAWSGGLVDKRTQLYQYSNNHVVGGSQCDYNHALKPDFGQWGWQVKKPPPPPKPPEDKHASAEVSFEIQFDERTGGWRGSKVVIKPLPFNANPLG